MIKYYTGIFKKLTISKSVNFLKLLAGFHYSRLINRPVQFGMPVFVSIEPTTSCNLRCPQCPSGLREFTRPTGMLDSRLFEKIIGQLKNHLHSLTFYFQGEPYLNPSFLEMVKYAGQSGIYTITSTNAHYMTPDNATATVHSKLDKLIISVDGITQDVYRQYRIGGQLSRVIEGTKEILKKKKELKSSTPHVVWQFVVFRHNEHQVDAVKKMGRELGVDEVKIKTAQIYDYENGGSMIPENENFARYRKNSHGVYEIRNKMQNHCWRMWQGCVITWDGKIVPCCFDKDASHRLGDLATQKFSQVWHSQAYNSFRRSVLKNRSEIEICTNCTEGTKVFS